ncbi:TadE/TadG family type IV pilus assembly protein [Nonomuraea sp. CA-141351]|uniref:TadE/TadG family type IV pilus assembly protein n=1 Tax=Nonomuraea sp. CA-141351 TaxID=3239996 RepID=UPI003D9408D7
MKGRERGSATLEAAVIYPVVLLLVLLAVNVALWFDARNLALSAAQEGLRVGRAYGSSLEAGKAAAARFAREAGGSFLLSPAVDVKRGGDTVTVTVHGQAISLIPLLTISIDQVAQAPVEKWTVDES